MDKKDILERQITALENCNVAALKEKFSELYGFECGATNAKNLRNRIAYKLQEIYFGGLSDEDKALLTEIANNDPASNLQFANVTPRPLARGTRLCRDWKGKTYEVIVHPNNKFEFEGEMYRSLSAIADKITGTHWNGKKFFGVK